MVTRQGVGKSSGVKAISPDPEFFLPIKLDAKDDDLSRLMRGKLVIELSELRGLHSRELEAIKAFITQTHENWIPKYREAATVFPRRCLMFGTTNNEEFLADDTGNRRFLPVRCSHVNLEAILRDREQLWAEGRELFEFFGVCWQQAQSLASDAHAEHSLTDVWEEIIDLWLDKPVDLDGSTPRSREFLQIADVMRDALGFNAKDIRAPDEKRAGSCLRKLGYKKDRPRIAGKRITVWRDGHLGHRASL